MSTLPGLRAAHAAETVGDVVYARLRQSGLAPLCSWDSLCRSDREVGRFTGLVM